MRVPAAACLVCVTFAAATAAAAMPSEVAAVPTAQAPAQAPAAVENFSYNPEGRRDPFVSLTARGSDQSSARAGQELDGAGGLSADEISVRGIVATGNGYVAMVQGPNGKTFVVHQSDKLLDGTVKSITAQAIVILQDVSDPLSVVKQKEVRKLLRGLEEGK
jgi:Tfp pilus assembly protein PilP